MQEEELWRWSVTKLAEVKEELVRCSYDGWLRYTAALRNIPGTTVLVRATCALVVLIGEFFTSAELQTE